MLAMRSRSLLRLPRELLRRFSSSDSPHKTENGVLVYETSSTDPFFNLALEEFLFQRHLRPSSPAVTLFLWRNKPSVILGKHQNPYKECNMARIEEMGVELVRRHSGGGTVYQDLGNSIFSFITRDSPGAKERNNKVLIGALQSLGVTAVASGRNDINVNGLKVSGCAFKRDKGVLLHHGTMLINLDMNALGGYLTPHKLKLQAKGVNSVGARVMNLVELLPRLDHRTWCQALCASLAAEYGNVESPVTVDSTLLATEPTLKATYDALRKWEWRFGRTPEFTHNLETRFEWGLLDVYLTIQEGVIVEARIFSDCLFPALVEALAARLRGTRYHADNIRDCLREVRQEMVSQFGVGSVPVLAVDDFEKWLVAQL